MSSPDTSPLDEMDIAILKHLAVDGRKPFTEIAEQLGVSHGTVRNRFQRMQELHSLKMAAWLDPQRVGFHAGAHIKFSIEAPFLQEATAAICAYPEVTWMGQTLGEFNLMGDLFCRHIQHLNQFVFDDLRSVASIRHMELGVYTRIYKVCTLPALELLEGTPLSTAKGAEDRLIDSAEAYGQPAPQELAGGDRPAMSAMGDSTLDSLDIAILEHLSADGRKPFTEIAQALGVSHGTVRNRYARMLDMNAVKVVCWLDPGEVNFHAVAHLDFSFEPPLLQQAAMEMATFPEVVWLAQVLGQFNLMADVMCRDMGSLDDLASNHLGKMPGLRRMDVALYANIAKFTTMPNLELLHRVTEGERLDPRLGPSSALVEEGPSIT